MLCFMTFAPEVSCATDLHQSVVLVKPNYEELHQYFTDYSLPLYRKGYSSESRAFMAYHSGISGSGVVVSKGDSLVVITNRHVIGLATIVDITYQLGKQSINYHCPVIAVSPQTDLAMILLPDTARLVPISINTGEIEEAEEIYAAGFPGLGNEPTWQVSKGIISNAALYREELLGVHQAAIQHTAAIDPGNSGGALLRRLPNNEYELVGINTWKASSREGVGLAIPANTVLHFIQNGTEEETKSDEQLTNEWNQLLREDAIQAAAMLSVEYLTTRSVEDWQAVIESMGYTNRQYISEAERNSAVDIIRYTWAIDMMRFAMAGGSDATFKLKWGNEQGKYMIIDVTYPELTKKQYNQATSRLKK